MRGLPGRVAVITGGAQGLGEAMGLRLSEEGAIVWLLDAQELVLETAKSIAAQTGNTVYGIQTNITSEEEVQAAFEQISENVGRVDILVNNAARFIFKGVEASDEDWDAILDVNIKGTSRVTRLCLPFMRKTGGGSIINLSSVSGFIAQRQFSTYNATKFAIRGLTKTWALDLAKDNIRVNSICPGYIRTPAFEASCHDLGLDIAEENERVSKMHILGRQGEPSEVGAAVAFLASDDASYITGTDLLVDGGYLAM